MDVIFCGHSLGGAVASIASIRLEVEKARYKLKGSVKCITFGAPLFGDEQLRKSTDCRNMYHFVCNNDPVPNLLSYTQSISSYAICLDAQIASLTHSLTGEGESYHQKNIETLRNKKVEYQEMFPQLEPIDSSIFEKDADLNLGATEVHKKITNVFVPIGNFYFLDDETDSNKLFQCNDFHDIHQHMENNFKAHSKVVKSDGHALSNYTNLLRTSNQPKVPFDKYLTYVRNDSSVKFPQPFAPVIHSVGLVKVENRSTSILRMSFTGVHLFEIVLEQCQFRFNFPFASNKDNTTVKKVYMGENIQRLVLEETCKEKITISAQGTNVTFATQLGKCEKVIWPGDFRDLVIASVLQVANRDTASLVVTKAIQRGMALANIEMGAGCRLSDRMINKIMKLGDIALEKEDMNQVRSMFESGKKYFQFILSDEKEFAKFKEFSQKIENYLDGPLEIRVNRSYKQKLVYSIAMGIGCASIAVLTGPFSFIVGGGLLGGLGVGIGTSTCVKITLDNGVSALQWINQQLLEAKMENLDENQKSQIKDLQDDGTTYSQEKILMLLTERNDDIFRNIGECVLNQCTEETKEIIRGRIKAVIKIHKIRDIFSQQCFIGLVGLQDAGKTTLLRKIWGVGGKTGFFIHTDAPLLYEVTPKLLVVDFPGSNSLDSHAKTFSICGAINNMVIVVIPFTGDISEVISDEVHKVFDVMRGSDSTKVILCINKCGLNLQQLKEELKAEEAPVEYLKKRFVNKLNERYKNTGTGIVIKNEDILFTDWEVGDEDEAKKFGIVGVEVVKARILEYLVNYGIYKEEEEDELRRCVSTLRL